MLSNRIMLAMFLQNRFTDRGYYPTLPSTVIANLYRDEI